MSVQVQAILDSISTRKDGSIKLVFETQEVSSKEGFNLFEMRDRFGWLAFAPQKSELKIPEEPAVNPRIEKSPSQRLRNVIFVLWKQLGASGDFEDYYRKQMERMIEQVKERLDPEK